MTTSSEVLLGSTSGVNRQAAGFSLLELALGMAVLALVAAAVTPVAIRYVRQDAAQKTAREIRWMLEAGRAFYVANNRWPNGILELQTAGHLPPGNLQSPFTTTYDAGTMGAQFQVTVSVPADVAPTVVRLLPFATSTMVSGATLVSAVTSLPGTAADASMLLHRQGTLVNSAMLGPLELTDQAAGGTANVVSRGSGSWNIFEGRVGIGSSVPEAPLEVRTDISATGSRGVAVTSSTESNNNGLAFAVTRSSGATVWGTNNTGLQFGNTTTGTTGYRIAPGEDNISTYLNVAGGNVGIGTTAPASKLDVVGSVKAISATMGRQLYFWDPVDALYLSAEDGGVVDLRWLSQRATRGIDRFQSAGGGGAGASYYRYFYLSNAGGSVVPVARMSGLDGNLHVAGGIGSGGVPDVAENVRVSDQSIEPGDLVAIDRVTPSAGSDVYDRMVVRKARGEHDPDLVGAISPGGGLTLAADAEVVRTGRTIISGKRLLVLAGRIPVKVSTENGPIRVGDRITTSSIPGIGMRAARPGMTLGIAAEALDQPATAHRPPVVRPLLVFINLSWFDPSAAPVAGSAPAARR